MGAETVLLMKGISKRFGRLLANDDINLSLKHGEILALLGENGAGKTTLMSILFGNYVADSGSIEVFGQPLKQGSTREALTVGVGMVQQHFALAGNLSVFDNIVVGVESLGQWHRRYAVAREKILRIARQCDFNVRLDVLVRTLSVGERQKIEILKALYRDAKILVLDEPTAVLAPKEVSALFVTLRRLVANGLSIIIISHKLNEILEISHRICVLHHGKLTYEIKTAVARADDIAHAMIGQKISRKEKKKLTTGAPLLCLKDVYLTKQSTTAISFTLHEHEILGISGVSGNGQRELCGLLNGLSKPFSGATEWMGKPLSPKASDMTKLGVARIPEDRGKVGVVGDMTVTENLISNSYGEFCRAGFFDFIAIDKQAAGLLKNFDVRCGSAKTEARLLSGGNMQKLILARELSRRPKIIIASQPTRGLDVGAIYEVHRLLLEARENGAGVILITEELDELFALSDKIAVMFKGTLSDFFFGDSVNERQIGLMMSGSTEAT